jgi:hypothetical protein
MYADLQAPLSAAERAAFLALLQRVVGLDAAPMRPPPHGMPTWENPAFAGACLADKGFTQHAESWTPMATFPLNAWYVAAQSPE